MRADTNVALQHVASENSNLREAVALNSNKLQCTQDGLDSALQQLPAYVKGKILQAVHALTSKQSVQPSLHQQQLNTLLD